MYYSELNETHDVHTVPAVLAGLAASSALAAIRKQTHFQVTKKTCQGEIAMHFFMKKALRDILADTDYASAFAEHEIGFIYDQVRRIAIVSFGDYELQIPMEISK